MVSAGMVIFCKSTTKKGVSANVCPGLGGASEKGPVREKRGQMRARVQELASLQQLTKPTILRFNV